MNDNLGNSSELVPEPDDFKLIGGIGPRIEDRLVNAGIVKYEQLAGLSPDEIVSILGDLVGLTVERIKKQDWLGQAHGLAEKARELQPMKGESGDFQMHYASFTVEILLDEENNARRTRTVHIQSETERTWAGWDKDQLDDFFIQCSGLRIPQNEPALVGETPAEPEPAAQPVTATLPLASGAHIWLSELLSIPEGFDKPYRSIPKDKVVSFELKLNFKEFSGLTNQQIPYSATVSLQKVGSRIQKIAGTAQGQLTPAETIPIRVRGEDIDKGTYRLNAAVELDPEADGEIKSPVLKAQMEGGLLQVY